MQPVALVTGSNSGIGRAAAIALAEKGHKVYAACRTPAKAIDLEAEAARRGLPIVICALDVTDHAAGAALVEAIVAAEGHLDLLVNNAGYGVSGVVEEVTMAQARHLFETNVFGLLALTQAVLPAMRRQRRGRIINLSSVAGAMAAPGMGLYCASKFAVEAMSDSLRIEVADYGIQVVVIQPGPIDTPFDQVTWGTADARPYDTRGPYAHVYAMIEGSRRDFLRFRQPAQAVAKVIVKAATTPKPEPRYTVTLPAAVTPMLKRFLPEKLMNQAQIHLIRRYGRPKPNL